MRAINILRIALCLFAANVSAEDGLERCVGKICVSAKENLMQFKAKWSANIAPSKTRTPDSYPVLCLWDQKRHLSYQFEFIGTHGGSGPMDAPVGKTQLGEITISQSDFCKSAQNKKGNIAESFMSQMLGKNISEVMLKKGKPYRIDDINEVQRSQSNVNSPVEKIAKQYVYLLNPEATLLINSYYTNSIGKIVRTSISERP